MTPGYSGFKVSFGPANEKFSFFNEYKAPFRFTGSDWQRIYIPFTHFSQDWSSYTGRCDTKDPTGKQHHCCGADHPENCPTRERLASITQMSVWAEGAAGHYHVEIQSIRAIPAGSACKDIVELAQSVPDLSTLVTAV
jgi:hypothetical protein